MKTKTSILFRTLFAIVFISTLAGCTLPMTKVIETCNNANAPFPEVSQCIQQTYAKNGNHPNATSVKSFYAELAVITEDYQSKKITDAQARAKLYRAYSNTVDADNRSTRVCMPIGGMIVCQ
jgi:hypothetical protein